MPNAFRCSQPTTDDNLLIADPMFKLERKGFGSGIPNQGVLEENSQGRILFCEIHNETLGNVT